MQDAWGGQDRGFWKASVFAGESRTPRRVFENADFLPGRLPRMEELSWEVLSPLCLDAINRELPGSYSAGML